MRGKWFAVALVGALVMPVQGSAQALNGERPEGHEIRINTRTSAAGGAVIVRFHALGQITRPYL